MRLRISRTGAYLGSGMISEEIKRVIINEWIMNFVCYTKNSNVEVKRKYILISTCKTIMNLIHWWCMLYVGRYDKSYFMQ